MASVIIALITHGLPARELIDSPQKTKAVTVEQVNQVAQELLHPDRFVIVTAGPPWLVSRVVMERLHIPLFIAWDTDQEVWSCPNTPANTLEPDCLEVISEARKPLAESATER